MRIIVLALVNAAALGVAIWLLDGITLEGPDRETEIVRLVIVGLIFGLVNSFVKPVLNFIAFPAIILTLGLMLLVTSALMLLLTSRISESLGLGFSVDGFWTAVLGAVVIGITTWVMEAFLRTKD